MFQSFFNGLSGLFSFSRGLQTISQNVANMNTPGFRGSDNFFRSLNGGGGSGTQLIGTGIRTKAGETRQTGNPGDLALDGSGFFILRDADGNTFYTRAGQFNFDANGILIDQVSKAKVMSIDASGNLTEININDRRSLPAQVTTLVNLTGQLPPDDGTSAVTSGEIQVFDPKGNAHKLIATFTSVQRQDPNDPNAPAQFYWTVEFKEADKVVGSTEIRFLPDGTILDPEGDGNTVSLTLDADGAPFTFTVDFGQGQTGIIAKAGASKSVTASKIDGRAEVGLTSFNFDEKGILHLIYGSENVAGEQVAVAGFSDESALQYASGSLFRSPLGQQAVIGRPGENAFARIKAGSLELSNVDLTQEFGDMLVFQRGYQASSRVMTVSNEMIEQLYNSSRGG